MKTKRILIKSENRNKKEEAVEMPRFWQKSSFVGNAVANRD